MADMHPQAETAAPIGAGHEPSEVGIRRIFIFGGGLVVVTIVVMVALALMMGRFKAAEERYDRERPALYQDETGQYPEPRLQRNYTYEMNRLRDEDRAALGSYGWVDQKAGVARIPVDRAIAILAERGLPKSKPKASPKAATPSPTPDPKAAETKKN